MTVLVSGGADSTCLWHTLRELGYEVSALHVEPRPARARSPRRTPRFCRDVLGAEVVDGRGGTTEDEWREIRYSFATDRLRATGPHRVRPGRDRPLPDRRQRRSREDRLAPRRRRRPSAPRPLARRDRGLLPRRRPRLPPRLVQPGHEARADPRRDPPAPPPAPPGRRGQPPAPGRPQDRAAGARPLLESIDGSTRLDLGRGRQIVREYDRAWLERSPVALDSEVRWGPWRITAEEKGLKVRGWRPGDHLAGRRKKIQDVFVDAKVPRSEREAWPLVVRGDEVVAVPGNRRGRGSEGGS